MIVHHMNHGILDQAKTRWRVHAYVSMNSWREARLGLFFSDMIFHLFC